jgi:hypothetical protein
MPLLFVSRGTGAGAQWVYKLSHGALIMGVPRLLTGGAPGDAPGLIFKKFKIKRHRRGGAPCVAWISAHEIIGAHRRWRRRGRRRSLLVHGGARVGRMLCVNLHTFGYHKCYQKCCEITQFPIRYLGLPSALCLLTKAQWQPMLDMAQHILPSWKRGLVDRP